MFLLASSSLAEAEFQGRQGKGKGVVQRESHLTPFAGDSQAQSSAPRRNVATGSVKRRARLLAHMASSPPAELAAGLPSAAPKG